MADKKYKKTGPILLNYTGEIIRIKLPAGKDKRFQKYNSKKDLFLVLPPLGKPIIKTELVKGPDDIFPTVHYAVKGLPAPGFEVFYIVNDNIARTLSRIRNDLMIICDRTITSSGNILDPDEIYIDCTEIAHVLVEIE